MRFRAILTMEVLEEYMVKVLIVSEELSLSEDSYSELQQTAKRTGFTEDEALSWAVTLLHVSIKARAQGRKLVLEPT